jgi:anti-sigma regulatory factor (Ser/Thr protein kinase)
MDEKIGLSRPAILRLVLACDLGQVRSTARAAHDFLAAAGCHEKELGDCELALVEACNNAIQYAPESARKKPVLVEILCDTKEVELRVTDHTPGFDWPKRALLPAAQSVTGRGVYLMQSLMDYADYFRAASENILILRKTRRRGD